jgi:type II secretory ATPase GspE/PulE/Tfp pilus assembly ATPase PilB-like protein
VRQSPDVILIGEMRDRETMEAAIAAAETGHLVLSTLHTVNALQTVERIINFFPPHQHDLIRLQLSLVLVGVISQRLLPRKGTGGRVPAVELMIESPTIRDLIRKGRTEELYGAVKPSTSPCASSIRTISSPSSTRWRLRTSPRSSSWISRASSRDPAPRTSPSTIDRGAAAVRGSALHAGGICCAQPLPR